MKVKIPKKKTAKRQMTAIITTPPKGKVGRPRKFSPVIEEAIEKNVVTKRYAPLLDGPMKKVVIPKTESLTKRTLSIPECRYILFTHNNRTLRNRKLMHTNINKYSQDMVDGHWCYTGEPLIFSPALELMQGQNRLYAALKSGVPLTIGVSTGITRLAFESMDNGGKRDLAAALYTQGITHESKVHADCVKAIWAYENGRIKNNRSGDRMFTTHVGMDVAANHPEVARYIDRYAKNLVLSKQAAAFTYWLLDTRGNGNTVQYLDRVLLGEGLTADDTVEHALRNKLLRASQKKLKMTTTAKIANIIIGWKKYTGELMTSATYTAWDPKHGFPTV